MPLTPLVPALRLGDNNRSWAFAASTALHLVAIGLAIVTPRLQPQPPVAEPSYDLVFEGSAAARSDPAKPPGLPPIQPADIPTPDDAPLGNPAPAALSPPQPDGVATQQPETATSAAASASAPAPEPPEPADTPAPAVSPPTQLAFAPPAEPAVTPAPTPPEARPETAPPTVNLQLPSENADQRIAPLELPPIIPQPPPPQPQQQRPAPRPRPPTPPRQALGTLSNPMDLSLSPAAPRPAARGSVASRAIDLSPPAERQGPSRSDPYAQIRSANASEDWNRGLRQYWLQHRFYPPQAAQNGEEGTVTIQLTVDRSGRVDDVQVLSRSGSQWLDMAAVSTWRNARLPPFTNEMRQDRLTFPIPITYYLVRR